MKFNNYADGVRERLVEARFTALENMINQSNELEANIFVVAGDLFNTIQVSKGHISKTVRILGKFNGACVIVLPGNHDYDNGVNELWQDFIKVANEKILLVNEERPYSLSEYDLDAVIYPGPCHSKHSKENSLQWIKDSGLEEMGKYHIGIAHGAIEGLSPDIEGNYYYMSMDELDGIPMDLWLLGHTHLAYPNLDKITNHRVFNAGTPEPDGLDFKANGGAWFINLHDSKISAQRIITGQYMFLDTDFHLNSSEDLEEIQALVLKDNPEKKIVRLNLSGSLPQDVYENMSGFYNGLESKLFHLMVEDSNLKVKINKDIIESEFTKGSFPYEFLTALSHDQEALQIAYDILRRG